MIFFSQCDNSCIIGWKMRKIWSFRKCHMSIKPIWIGFKDSIAMRGLLTVIIITDFMCYMMTVGRPKSLCWQRELKLNIILYNIRKESWINQNKIVPDDYKEGKAWVNLITELYRLGYIDIYLNDYVYLRELAYICVSRYTQNIFTI